MILIVIFALLFLLIDIGSKLLVSHFLYPNESIKIIDGFLQMTYVKNTGAAWSIFADKSFVVVILSAIIIGAISVYICKNKPRTSILKIAYALILGGAIGNFADRIFHGYVIDFIDVSIFGYDYPIFNVADCFIVMGVIILIVATWRCNDGNTSGK